VKLIDPYQNEIFLCCMNKNIKNNIGECGLDSRGLGYGQVTDLYENRNGLAGSRKGG
jgi:hypothetical protein